MMPAHAATLWAYRPTSTPHVYELLHDGRVAGGVSFITDLPEALTMEDIVWGLNNPVPLADRGFRGPAKDMLERHRGHHA